MEERVCPYCGQVYTDYPALSRRDNKTYICPECGFREAMEAFLSATETDDQKEKGRK